MFLLILSSSFLNQFAFFPPLPSSSKHCFFFASFQKSVVPVFGTTDFILFFVCPSLRATWHFFQGDILHISSLIVFPILSHTLVFPVSSFLVVLSSFFCISLFNSEFLIIGTKRTVSNFCGCFYFFCLSVPRK